MLQPFDNLKTVRLCDWWLVAKSHLFLGESLHRFLTIQPAQITTNPTTAKAFRCDQCCPETAETIEYDFTRLRQMFDEEYHLLWRLDTRMQPGEFSCQTLMSHQSVRVWKWYRPLLSGLYDPSVTACILTFQSKTSQRPQAMRTKPFLEVFAELHPLRPR
jgi:hypothetical protein